MITIKPLNNHPEVITRLVNLWCDSLGQDWMPDTTQDEVKSWYLEWVNDTLPMAYVALDGDEVVGSFSLQWSDGIREDLTPWLGDLIIAPTYRGQGIGKQLASLAVKKIKALGFKKLYLFTPCSTFASIGC